MNKTPRVDPIEKTKTLSTTSTNNLIWRIQFKSISLSQPFLRNKYLTTVSSSNVQKLTDSRLLKIQNTKRYTRSHSSNRLCLHQAMAITYKNTLPVAPPPTVQRKRLMPSFVSLKSSILIFIPKIPATTTNALTTKVAVVNITPIWSRWFCLSSSIMFM